MIFVIEGWNWNTPLLHFGQFRKSAFATEHLSDNIVIRASIAHSSLPQQHDEHQSSYPHPPLGTK